MGTPSDMKSTSAAPRLRAIQVIAGTFSLVGLVAIGYYVVELAAFFAGGFLDGFEEETATSGSSLASSAVVVAALLIAVVLAGLVLWGALVATGRFNNASPWEVWN